MLENKPALILRSVTSQDNNFFLAQMEVSKILSIFITQKAKCVNPFYLVETLDLLKNPFPFFSISW